MREISLTARPNVFQIATVGGWHAVSLEWYVVRVDNGFHYSDVNAMVGRNFEVPKTIDHHAMSALKIAIFK